MENNSFVGAASLRDRALELSIKCYPSGDEQIVERAALFLRFLMGKDEEELQSITITNAGGVP